MATVEMCICGDTLAGGSAGLEPGEPRSVLESILAGTDGGLATLPELTSSSGSETTSVAFLCDELLELDSISPFKVE